MWAQWFVGIGTFALALATVWVTLIKPWMSKPRLSVEFHNRLPYCRESTLVPKEFFTVDDYVAQQVSAYWIRLKIVNSGNSLARRCIGKLAKVMNESGDEFPDHDPVQLHWHNTSWEDFPLRPVDLNPGEHEYLDVLHTRADCPTKALICRDLEPRGLPTYFKPGKYKLQITIYGDNVEPKSKIYYLIWGASDFKDISLEEKKADIQRGKSKLSIATRWLATHFPLKLAVAFLAIAIGLFALGYALRTEYPLNALSIFIAAYVTLISSFIRFVAEVIQKP